MINKAKNIFCAYPLVSVIVPVYNKKDYIKRCLESILKQTLANIEIILIDDGSTDNSLELLQSFSKADKRIKVISQQNQGLSATRNYGIKIANAEVLAFIDADDEVELDMLEKMYSKMIDDDSDIVYAKLLSIDESGQKIYYRDIEHTMDGFDPFAEIISYNMCACAPAAIYKKTLFIENNIFFPVNRFYEDSAFTFKLYFFAKKVSILNESFYKYYLYQNDSIMTNCKKNNLEDAIFFLKETKDFLFNKKVYKQYKSDFEMRVKHTINGYVELILKNNKHSQDEALNLLVYFWDLLFKNGYFDLDEQELKNLMSLTIGKIILLDKRDLFEHFKNTHLLTFVREKVNNLDNQSKLMKNLLKNLDKLENLSEICIYGTGNIYEYIIKYIHFRKIKICMLFDSINKGMKDGMIINQPQIITDKNKSTIVVLIASLSSVDSMLETMRSISVRSSQKIIVVTYKGNYMLPSNI